MSHSVLPGPERTWAPKAARRVASATVDETLVGRGEMLEVLLADCRRRQSILLAGSAGVGKSRLWREVLDRLAPTAWTVERFVATASTQSIPFGALISLLPQGASEDRTQVLAAMRAAVLERAGGRRPAVAVDDAHQLDESSLAFIADLAHHHDALVLLTARTDDAIPATLTSLWSSGALDRVAVEPLTDDATIELATELLGGPVHEALANELISSTRGNPLLIRELLLDTRASSAVACEDGTWRQLAPLDPGPRLQELVTARVGRLTSDELQVLELVAVGEPLASTVLDVEEGPLLDVLERRGLARIEADERGLSVRTDHPLIGETIRAALPTRRRGEVLRELAERIAADGCPHPGDALRAAGWWRDAGGTPPAGVAARAAQDALSALDLDRAVELSVLALDEVETCSALTVLGETRRLRGEPAEAEIALGRAAALADSDGQTVHIAMLRSNLLAHHLGQPGSAIELLETAAAAVHDPGRALELESEASYLAGLRGHLKAVIGTTRRLLTRRDLTSETEWTTIINLLYAQVTLGRLDEIDEPMQRALELSDDAAGTRPEGTDLLWSLRAGVYIERGELSTGERVIGEHVEACSRSNTIHGATSAILVILLTLRGSPQVFELIERTFRQLDASDPFAVLPLAAGAAALAHVRASNVDAALTALDRVPDDVSDVRARPWLGRARAGLSALSGDLDTAAEIAADSGREALDINQVAFGMLALHDAARYGRPELVADTMVEVAAESDAQLLRDMTEHAVALRDEDGKALDAAAQVFLIRGAPHLAATVAAQAASSHTPGSVAARRSAARSQLWARSALAFKPPNANVADALSTRELDVAALAVAAAANKDIAERLFVSRRTVENHLQRVYRKLEVAGRGELAEMLSPAEW